MLTNVLKSKAIRYRLGGHSEIHVCCPFCVDMGETEDTRFRLSINERKNVAFCFNCNYSAKNYAIQKFLKRLKESIPDDYENVNEQEEQEEETPELPESFELLLNKKDEFHRQAIQYLEKRGYSLDVVKKKNVGICMTGKYAYRIVFPVLWKGYLRGVVGRAFTNSASVKYLNSTGQKWIWNLRYTPSKGKQQVVLSEGIFKALSIELHLGVRSGALLGHNITERMIGQLQDGNYKKVILWSDPIHKDSGEVDRSGILGMNEIASKLTDLGFKVMFVWPPPKKQADELSVKDLEKAWESVTKWDWALSAKIRSSV